MSIDKGASEATDTDKKSGPGNTPGKPDPDAKDKPELAASAKTRTRRRTPRRRTSSRTRKNTIHNRDQDPNHPANKTLSRTGDASPRPDAEGITVPPEELLTEQEKEAVGSGPAGDTTAGVGPVAPAAHTTGPVETIEDQGIGPRTPYPTGNPPPAREETTLSQGIWQGDEAEARGPNKDDGKTYDPRPQPRIGGPQETTHPPKEDGR